MKIKKKNTTIPISGKIVDTENVEDKTSNAPSMRLVKEMTKDIYSTDEQVIGTWIDGKPLYMKVVNLGNLPDTSSKFVPHNISDIGEVIISGFGDSGTTKIPLPFANPQGAQYSVQIACNLTDIIVDTKNNYSTYTGYAILKYTKTTD